MRVSAVSYLNTWPLVWGFLHGPGEGLFEFQFDLPSRCADALGAGEVDVGLVPCAELDRLGIDFLPDLGIACEGAVRSILLVSKVPFADIQTLAVDDGSRTSVALARILLAGRYSCEPEFRTRAPRIEQMLAECDAALIIGDPALHLEPGKLTWRTLDLGAEWMAWTGLPMVFAVWAGRREVLSDSVAKAFAASYQWGRERTGEIVERAVAERGFPAELAREYLTRHIVYELSGRHLEGLSLFRRLARELAPASIV
ncbi:MAG: menaquinone biosynthesis protein [Acidobacteriota bacterium]|nr:menaquinone biosynthesis protein [Acidobacteriota bacterium]